MSDQTNAATEEELFELNYGTLMNVGRSARENHGAEVQTDDSPTKDVIAGRLEENDVHLDGDTWFIGDDEVDLLPVQTPDRSGGDSGPTDTTVLYCLTRAETTEERVERIRGALEEEGFELREAGSGDKYSIVIPAPDEEVEEDEEDEEDENGDFENVVQRVDGKPAEPESEPEEGEEDDEGEEEDEAAEEAAEPEDEEEEDDTDLLPRGAVRERLEERTYDEVYEMATEFDVSGRSSMDKAELIEGVLDNNPDVKDE